MQGASGAHCSLCSREYRSYQLRRNVVPGAGNSNDYLCQMCWQVLSPQPWPAQDASHEGRQLHGSQQALKAVAAAAGWGAAAPRDGKAAAQAAPSAFAQAAAGRPVSQRRGDGAGFRPVGGASAMAVPTAQQQHWHPASMPEPHVMLAGSAEECRWNPMGSGVAGSAPVTAPMLGAPPTFSPVELRNMMDEESLMLFESQSHLLDPESRVALQRQREYLQWQNSLDEPGPMQSVLERQDSAGSGCNHDGVEQHDGSGAGTCGRDSGGSGSDITRELDDTRRQLASVTAERERLAVQLRRTQAELEAQRRTTTCTMCWRAQRNCVILPCLHFMSCDDCFKRHCSAAPTCPACNTSVTGFQTLFILP